MTLDQPIFETKPFKPKATAMEAALLASPSAKAISTIAVFDVGAEDGKIPPREWLLGWTFCRKVLSALIGTGGFGKTSMRILQALALTCGRELTGEHIFFRSRVLIICLEDDMDELRRRVRAAMLHHGVKPSDVAGWLFLTTPRGLKIAELGEKKKVQHGGLYQALVAQIDRFKIDLLVIDPAVKAHGGLDENSNSEIDAFAAILTGLAIEKNVAIDVLAHERKGSGDAGDVNRGRGAGALKDAARLVYTITPMSEDDAKALAVSADERRGLVRIDSAKVNTAPPSASAKWFRFVGVALQNGTADYPAGDNVGTLECWTPEPIFEGLTSADLNRALARINAGMENGQRYSTAGAATKRAAWHAVKAALPELEEARCKAVVRAWDRNDVFIIGKYSDPVSRAGAVGILSAALIGVIDTSD
jgi:hypothetical protein